MNTRRLSISVLLALATTLAAAPGRASDADDAHAFYAHAQELSARGRYLDAVAEYQRGYALTREPRFLLAMAGAYRISGDLPRARDYYRRFLQEAPADDPERARGAAELRESEPVILKPEPLRAVEDNDGGRTQAEIRQMLGEEEYARYLASHLTLAAFHQRDRGNMTALEGAAFALASAAGGVTLFLTAGATAHWRAVTGYCVMVVGFPVGLGIMRYGYMLSSTASVQVRAPHFAIAPVDGGRGLAANLALRF
jgi:tetratricopeptide (TPR) repeat protein